MARRSDHSPEELKELAIAKGLEIIDKKGLAAFSLRQVAAAIGYTAGMLSHSFGNVEGLRLHINGRILDEWHAGMLQGLKTTRREPLRYLVGAYIDFARARRSRWASLFETGMEESAPLPPWYAEKLLKLFALVERALPSGRGIDARRDAKVLWAGVHGICVLSLSGKLDLVGAEKAETLAEALVETYLRGLHA